jgi:GTP-binding protein HflX
MARRRLTATEVDLAVLRQRALLVGTGIGTRDVEAAEASLEELALLTDTAGAEPVELVLQRRDTPDPATYIGSGKAKELQELADALDIDLVVFDDELTPAQQRNLERLFNVDVVDRVALILDIFAQHARSAEGKLQVELAQLEYNLPRMRGLWQHLERLGGGVGTRGPGESQLETDRRLARRRVSQLKGRLRELQKQRATRRKARRRSETPTIALAGYTNVGKSTLLNALTGAGASVNDRLFETLDPTTRWFEHHGRRYLVTDTVGFIRRLPHQLVEGFAATLEETLVADLVLHVADASASEAVLGEQLRAVNAVLDEIGAADLPVELVLNKADAVDSFGRRRLANRFPEALQISAHTGEGLDELRAKIAQRFADRFELVELLVPYADGGALAELYALGPPIESRTDREDGVLIQARLPERDVRRFARFLVADASGRRASPAA